MVLIMSLDIQIFQFLGPDKDIRDFANTRN